MEPEMLEEAPRARGLNRRSVIAASVAAGLLLGVVVMLVLIPAKGKAEAEVAPATQTAMGEEPNPTPVWTRHTPAGDVYVAETVPLPPLDGQATATPATWDAQYGGAAYQDPYASSYATTAQQTYPREPTSAERALQSGIRAESGPVTRAGGGGGQGADALGLAAQYAALNGQMNGQSVYSPPAPPVEVAAHPTTRSHYLSAQLARPGTGYEIPAGTRISAVMISAVNSDAPGDILAQVSFDVWDRHMSRVLIPRGTRMIGRPASDVSMGQRRLALVWDRLVLPDGRTVLLPEVPSQDSRGAAGLGASVNNHTGRTLVNAALLTLIGAGPALAQPNRGGWGNPSVGDVLAAETARQSAQVGNEVIRRGMDVRPTLSLPQGAEISVLLTADLELPAYR